MGDWGVVIFSNNCNLSCTIPGCGLDRCGLLEFIVIESFLIDLFLFESFLFESFLMVLFLIEEDGDCGRVAEGRRSGDSREMVRRKLRETM